MNQEGINEISKLRQVTKLYDKEKRDLKDKKKYTVSKKFKTTSGKDSRNVKHVDSRLKKDKRSLKASKTRQIKRTHKRRGKFWFYWGKVQSRFNLNSFYLFFIIINRVGLTALKYIKSNITNWM